MPLEEELTAQALRDSRTALAKKALGFSFDLTAKQAYTGTRPSFLKKHERFVFNGIAEPSDRVDVTIGPKQNGWGEEEISKNPQRNTVKEIRFERYVSRNERHIGLIKVTEKGDKKRRAPFPTASVQYIVEGATGRETLHEEGDRAAALMGEDLARFGLRSAVKDRRRKFRQ